MLQVAIKSSSEKDFFKSINLAISRRKTSRGLEPACTQQDGENDDCTDPTHALFCQRILVFIIKRLPPKPVTSQVRLPNPYPIYSCCSSPWIFSDDHLWLVCTLFICIKDVSRRFYYYYYYYIAAKCVEGSWTWLHFSCLSKVNGKLIMGCTIFQSSCVGGPNSLSVSTTKMRCSIKDPTATLRSLPSLAEKCLHTQKNIRL